MADLAGFPVASSRRAVFSPVKDDLEVKFVPFFPREETFEVSLGLDNIFSGAEAPAFGETVDVGIHGEGGYAKGLGHHDGSGFVPHSREGFKGFKRCGNFASVPVDEYF